MVTFRLLVLPIFGLILSFTQIDASKYPLIRQKRAGVCPDPAINGCLFVACENGGQCSQDLTTSDCFICQCAAGYTGKICETSISILPVGCSPGCQNGGVCNINICQCPTGYSGSFCETRNYCLPSNPCQNSGRCVSIGATFQCDCIGTGYTGTICTDVIPIDPCASNPCMNGGQCSSNGGQASCLCFNGYFGTNCQLAPIPCAAAPCENGGLCQQIAINVYGCECPAQFTGTRCETPILANHPCVTMPTIVCQNGGECLVSDTDYICKCAIGWGGRNCETKDVIDTCTPNPCLHGACYPINLPTGLMVFCNCDNRWTGKWCDVDIDASCPTGYCLSGGVCQLNGNTPYCQCPAMYTGARCETLITAVITTPIPGTICTPDICLSGGTCYVNNNVIGCACQPGWTGVRCETLIMPTTTFQPGVLMCASNPCQNGGTCYENVDTYRCDCVAPWAGPTCIDWSAILTTTGYSTAPPVGACISNPCYNGGICYPSGSSFTCICPSTTTGLSCETILPTTPSPFSTPGVPMSCADLPCQNGGSCVPMGTSYSCFCGLSSDYTGKNCDSTTPMPLNECPLDCTPARCIFSGFPSRPYACLWNGIMRPVDGTTG